MQCTSIPGHEQVEVHTGSGKVHAKILTKAQRKEKPNFAATGLVEALRAAQFFPHLGKADLAWLLDKNGRASSNHKLRILEYWNLSVSREMVIDLNEL